MKSQIWKTINLQERNWVFATYPSFLIPIYLQPNNVDLWYFKLWLFDIHSCMPSPLAPHPFRVQSCVCCLFWTNINSMAVISIFLSISLSYRDESFNRRYQLEIFTSTKTIVYNRSHSLKYLKSTTLGV